MIVKTHLFEDCLDAIKMPPKLQKNKYLNKGKFPVVAQEDSIINGYTNDENLIFKTNSPVIIFGDHTRKLKYIDFDFAIGADGVKIIKPKSGINVKFFFYYLTLMMPKNLGYARHYRLLKKIKFNIPSLQEQQNIVAKLDAVFAEIDKIIDFIKKKKQEIDTLNEAVLSDEFKLSSESKKLSEVCKIYNGGTPDTKNKIYWEGDKQWLTPRDMGKMTSEYVATSIRQLTEEGLKNSSANLIPKNSIILSCRAPIGHLAINKVPMSFNQGCKGLVPDHNIILHKYLYYFLLCSKKLLNNLGTGTTFKEISNKVLSNVEIRVPSLDMQKEIIYKFDLITEDLKKLKDIYKKQIENYSKLKRALIVKELGQKAA